MIPQEGQNIYGIPIGVLCLETYFPKPRGHIKNATTFDFPVTYKVVKGATVKRLLEEPDGSLLEPFIEATRELEKDGVLAITGSCGFLALFQKELADAVKIPVFVSSLIQVPMVHRMLRQDQKVGILTGNKALLTERHLRAVGVGISSVCIAGMESKQEFREVILEAKRNSLDFDKFGMELIDTAETLVKTNPEVGGIVLECTDMSYFAHLIQQKLRLPVFDIISLTNMVYHAVVREKYMG